MTAAPADLAEDLAAVLARLRWLPGRVSALAISVQRLRGPTADPHSARRREAFQVEVRALVNDSWTLWLEVGRLAEKAKVLKARPAPNDKGG